MTQMIYRVWNRFFFAIMVASKLESRIILSIGLKSAAKKVIWDCVEKDKGYLEKISEYWMNLWILDRIYVYWKESLDIMDGILVYLTESLDIKQILWVLNKPSGYWTESLYIGQNLWIVDKISGKMDRTSGYRNESLDIVRNLCIFKKISGLWT